MAEPVDMNGPAYTDPNAIKQRYSLADALTGRATQPFAPNWMGALAAGITGAQGAITRGSAEGALAQNNILQNNVFKQAAAAPNNIEAGKVLANSGIPELGSRGVERIITDRDQAEKMAIEQHKADSERIKANAASESVPKYAPNPVTGDLYSVRTGTPPPGTVSADPQAKMKAIVDKNFAQHEAPKLITQHGSEISSATDTYNTLSALEDLTKGGKVTTGFGANETLAMRRMLSQVLPNGWVDVNKIKDSELFSYLSQKGIFEYVQKLKPASNTDFEAAKRATISLQTDPHSLPSALQMLKTVAARSALSSQLKANHYANTGTPINGDMAIEIEREVNRRLPLPRPDFMRVTQGPATGERVQGKGGQTRFADATPEQRAATGEEEPAASAPQAPAPKISFTSLEPQKQVASIKRLRAAVGTPDEAREVQMFKEAFGENALSEAQRIIQGANFQPAGR